MNAPIRDIPHLRGQAAYELEQQLARQVGRAALDTGSSLPSEGSPRKRLGKPGDPRALRGIPVVGVIGGHIPGTSPGR